MYSNSSSLFSQFEYNVFEILVQCIPIWVQSIQFEYSVLKVKYNVFQFEYFEFKIWVQCIPRVQCIWNLSTMYSNFSTLNYNLNTIY